MGCHKPIEMEVVPSMISNPTIHLRKEILRCIVEMHIKANCKFLAVYYGYICIRIYTTRTVCVTHNSITTTWNKFTLL